MFNQRMRVFLTQNLNLDPHQAINEIHDCIETEVFEYAVCKREVLYNENVVYQGADILARTLKDVNGGVYNYCPCPCGIVFDTNLIPYRQIAIEYMPEPGQQVQVQEFDLQQHILDVQLQMQIPLEQIINRPPHIMDEQQRQQFMLQYQDFARQHYEGFLQQMMAPQGHVNLPQNVHNGNIQGHVENAQEYALNLQVPQPIQELEVHNEIIEQQAVVADEEEDESDEDVEMDIDEEDMEEGEEMAEVEEIEEEADEIEDFIVEEEQVHVVPQPPPLVEEPIQCYGISSTCSDDSDNEIRRGENSMNYNRRNAIQYNKISSTERMEGVESDSSEEEYDEIDDGDWSTDSADESNDYY